MKKIIIIFGILVVLGLGAWIFLRDGEAPVVENIRDVLPFGSGEDINIPALPADDTVGEITSFDNGAGAEGKVFRISNTPVAGFVILARESNTFARYVDRATGHIFETNLETNEKTRITNQTMPQIYEAHFRADGSEVLMRSLDESGAINNLTLSLTAPRATSTELYSISATNLRGDIDSVLTGSGNTLFYVLKDTGTIVSSTFTGSNLRTLFTSIFNNWRLERAGGNLIAYTKASAEASGFAYTLSSSGGSLSKLLGPLNGLTAIANSNGSRILYSYTEGGLTRLFARTTQNNTSNEILPATIAEKCTWSAEENNVFFCGTPLSPISGREPDNWYSGRAHFSDYVWRFDTDSEIAQLISNPKTDFDLDLDVYKPKLSANDEYLVFINKRDLTLWSIKLD